MLRAEFNKRWSWHELLHTVAEYMMIDMLKGMEQPTIMIFMYATLLKEKINVTKK